MKYCAGVDIGGTTIKIGMIDSDGALIAKWEIPTRKGENGLLFMKDIADEIKKFVEEKDDMTMEDLIGVGMGMPGPVLPDGYMEVCVNLDVHELYPARLLSELLGGIKTALANDANVAALGEMWQGAGKGQDSICMVTLGTGVGGGIVNEGRIVSGMHGAGGEIGHMCVEPGETEVCNCGGHGCLEQYASATGIVRVAKRKLASSDRPSRMRDVADLSAKDVCDLAKEGDELALESLRYSMDRLAFILSHIALASDPQMFVIGGGVSKAGTFLTDMISEEMKKYQGIVPMDRYDVALATLGNNAGIYGAARLVMPEEADEA